ncbi:MAG: hypothetical protein WCP01_09135 [Methylococcaceae bacterium]
MNVKDDAKQRLILRGACLMYKIFSFNRLATTKQRPAKADLTDLIRHT